MPNKVVHLDSIGPVTFFRNHRSKSIKLSVKPDKSVLVSYPFHVQEKDILMFLSKQREWISLQQEKLNARRASPAQGTILKTKNHEVELCNGDRMKTEQNGNLLKFYSPGLHTEEAQAALEQLLTALYRAEANIFLPSRLSALAAVHGFRHGRITIRNNRRNWGSCSSVNNISLNLQMMKLPDELIDYILLHELVHTEIKDHSVRFWRRLDQLTGNRSKLLASELRQYSTYTI